GDFDARPVRRNIRHCRSRFQGLLRHRAPCACTIRRTYVPVMFSSIEPSVNAPPAPVLLDYWLPDALRRAREAALVPLRPILLEFGLTYARYRLLCALAAA